MDSKFINHNLWPQVTAAWVLRHSSGTFCPLIFTGQQACIKSIAYSI